MFITMIVAEGKNDAENQQILITNIMLKKKLNVKKQNNQKFVKNQINIMEKMVKLN